MEKIKIIIETPAGVDNNDVSSVTLSLIAKSKSNQISQVTSGLMCKKHPGTPNIITISQTADNVNVDYSKLCCKQFREFVQTSVKKRGDK